MSVQKCAKVSCFAVHVTGLGPFPLERVVFMLLLQFDFALFLAGLGRVVLVLSTLLIALGVWQLRHRFSVAPSGLEIRWALFTKCVAFDAIESAALTADPRPWVVGARVPVLVVRRRSARPFVLIACRAKLEGFREALAAAGVEVW